MSTDQPQKKSFLDNLVVISLSLSALIILGGLLLIMFSDELPLEGIFGSGEIVEVDFETLAVDPKQNHYLSCPEDYCLRATVDQITPVYPVSVDVLSQLFLDYVDAQRRVEKNIARWKIAERQFEYLVYRGTNPFPDVVTFQFYDLGGNRSSLAIYSRTLQGDDEINANKNRVIKWLGSLGSE